MGLSSLALAAPQVIVDDAWIRGPPPGRSITAGYCTIVNRSAEAVVVVGWRAEGMTIEMHETRHEGGMARMRPLPRLVVPAGKSVALAPGGKHLMLFGVDAQALGDTLAIAIVLEDGEAPAVPFRVQPFGRRRP